MIAVTRNHPIKKRYVQWIKTAMPFIEATFIEPGIKKDLKINDQ